MTKKRKQKICKCGDGSWAPTHYPAHPFIHKRIDKNHSIIVEELITFDGGIMAIKRINRIINQKKLNELWRWVRCLNYFAHKCAYCRVKLSAHNTTRDHFIPRSQGGRNGANIVPACVICNTNKADMDPDKWCSEAQLKRIHNYIRDFRLRPLGHKVIAKL